MAFCWHCSLGAHAESSYYFYGLEWSTMACTRAAVLMFLQKVLDLFKLNRTHWALERFGQPNGAKFTLERRFGQRSDAKLALEW